MVLHKFGSYRGLICRERADARPVGFDLHALCPGLKLFDIKCAWFNEHEYCEYFLGRLFARACYQFAHVSAHAQFW
jgi:hypothetical protein